jgi:hypothetical protein
MSVIYCRATLSKLFVRPKIARELGQNDSPASRFDQLTYFEDSSVLRNV